MCFVIHGIEVDNMRGDTGCHHWTDGKSTLSGHDDESIFYDKGRDGVMLTSLLTMGTVYS
jgi:hypothetical protein